MKVKRIAENELAVFQGENRVAILENQLASFINAQALYTQDIQDIDRVATDLSSFRIQIDAGSSEDTFDSTTLFLFQLRVYGLGTSDGLQLSNFLTNDSKDFTAVQANALIHGLVLYAKTKKEILITNLSELEPQILATQQELNIAQIHERNLNARLSLANDTYTALSIKVEEELVTADVFAGQIRLASGAIQIFRV